MVLLHLQTRELKLKLLAEHSSSEIPLGKCCEGPPSWKGGRQMPLDQAHFQLLSPLLQTALDSTLSGQFFFYYPHQTTSEMGIGEYAPQRLRFSCFLFLDLEQTLSILIQADGYFGSIILLATSSAFCTNSRIGIFFPKIFLSFSRLKHRVFLFVLFCYSLSDFCGGATPLGYFQTFVHLKRSTSDWHNIIKIRHL